jgi:hypothetical protein
MRENLSHDPKTHRLPLTDPMFTCLVVGGYFIVALVGILHHEMWADELRDWLVGRKSESILALLNNCRNNGHPALWNIIVHLLTRITSEACLMQFVHLALATVGTYIFIKLAPFSRLHKALFVFGYFPLYEYAVISRPYVIGLICVYLFCALFRQRNHTYVGLALVLAILANTSVFGAILAITFAVTLVLDACVEAQTRASLWGRKADFIISAAIFLFGLSVTIAYMTPRPGEGFPAPWRTDLSLLKLGKVLTTIWNSYVPIPNFLTIHFWSTNFFDYFYPDYLHSVGTIHATLGLALIALALICFSRRPSALFCYLFGTVGILVFLYTKYFGFLRHHGHLFMLLMACLWLSYYTPRVRIPWPVLDRTAKRLGSIFPSLLTVLLSIHVVASAYAMGMDMVRPFSGALAVAQFISDNRLEAELKGCNPDWLCTSFAQLLDKSLYYPNSDQFGTFFTYDAKRKHGLECTETLDNLAAFLARNEPHILFLSVEQVNCNREGLTVELVATLENKCILGEESLYYLYSLKLDSSSLRH